MKKLLLSVLMLLGLGVVLSACVGIRVDEALVFQPQPIANKAESVEEMYIEWEAFFEAPTTFTFTNNINNDRSTFEITEEGFIPAALTHGFWADGAIAVTEFAVPPDDAAAPERPLVVHCGGNSSDRYGFGALFGLKVLPYADLVIFDYPGYGDSPGAPSAESFEAMLADLADELNARTAATDRPLVLWGYSLGGFVCSELLGEVDRVDAIIIEASARDAKSAARQLIPAFVRPFLRVRLSPSLAAYDNVTALQDYDGRILVLAGADDGILPAKLSRALVEGLEAAGASVAYHEFENGNHANLPTLEAYKDTLTAFFAQWEIRGT